MNSLLEGLLGDARRFDDLLQLHEERSEACQDEPGRAALNWSFASTWALRFSDLERAAYFYHKALVSAYSDGAVRFAGHLAAFTLLRELLAERGAWDELLQIADLALAGALPDDDVAILATQAGLVAWQELHDVERAGRYFARVQEVDPDSELLAEFIAAIGVDRRRSERRSSRRADRGDAAPARAGPPRGGGSHGACRVLGRADSR